MIVGAGGLGREVIWQIENSPNTDIAYKEIGFIDDSPELQGKEVNGYKVFGTIDWLRQQRDEAYVVLAIGSSIIRQAIYNKLKSNRNLIYPNITADGVKMSDLVELGRGCIFCLDTTVTVNIKIGDFFIANPKCTIGHDSKIHDFVTLYPNVNISGNVEIFSTSEIGTGTQIIQGKNVGSNCIIGAGAVVIRDIPDHSTAVGVPAKIIK